MVYGEDLRPDGLVVKVLAGLKSSLFPALLQIPQVARWKSVGLSVPEFPLSKHGDNVAFLMVC